MARHKWKQKGHEYEHEMQCVKCGCIKNTKVLGVTKYIDSDGNVRYNAGDCNPIIINKLMPIQLTHEGSIIIEGVKVGEWYLCRGCRKRFTGKMNDEGRERTIQASNLVQLQREAQLLLNSGFTPQKWEE